MGTKTPSPHMPVTQGETRLVAPLEHKRGWSGLGDKSTRVTVGIVYLVLILLGVGTGYLLSQQTGAVEKPHFIQTEKIVGTTDPKAFRDSAIGIIEKGGVDGEGTHRLIREGGPSQTAFLTSSIVDLDQYVGKKVKVYGETFAAEKAGWLMDVGKIELLQ